MFFSLSMFLHPLKQPVPFQMFPKLLAVVFYIIVQVSPISVAAAGHSYSMEELIAGFNKTVFGLEYRAWSWQPYLVKKYKGPVRFHISNLARKNRKPAITDFIRTINRQIYGLTAEVVERPEDANYKIYVVDRTQYADVVRNRVYKDPDVDVPGRCLVRVVSGRKGISRSAAVIVSDEGDFLFKRCVVEEILQGLGPMNDDESLSHSVFNDRSRHSRFTTFDKYILNMLYDRRIKPGMSPEQVKPLLPRIIRELRRKIK